VYLFRPAGENITYKEEEIRGLHLSYHNQQAAALHHHEMQEVYPMIKTSPDRYKRRLQSTACPGTVQLLCNQLKQEQQP